ncbi:tetratricopeptide repeat protein [Psychromonas aquimarina]|uniref:tetratricopeptide repeat protein n=1 Tax=Psychromonas aquimarina TaxID=444919 RepID=UPI0004110D72|nr:SEL1-like repeat protein [Psychromonas aquimarina]
MLILTRLTSILLLLTFCYSGGAFASAKFTQGYEASQAGDYKRAIELWTPLAEKGDAAAQYTLGWMYESGKGVPKNAQQAVYWYTKAAEQGDVASQYVLATMYEKGTEIPENQHKAVSWFLKAANQGDAVSQFKLGVHFQTGSGVQQSDKESLMWFHKAAEQGHITAQINLGKVYQSGKGTTQDYQLAIQWYETAATQGNALAQYHLAFMYEYGRGAPLNYQQAKSLYLKSATANYSPSAFKVAEFFELGKGGDIDLNNARLWYEKAASQGNNAAQYKLGTIYQLGLGTNKDIRLALDWYNQAARQNHALSLYQLGVIYQEGDRRIKVDYVKAAKYFQRASSQGNKQATGRLGYLYEHGLGVKSDPWLASSLYKNASQKWAQERYLILSKLNKCHENATTKLFTLPIACSSRELLRKKIKDQKITAINEDLNSWSDTYFTGAVIRGTSELEVIYTREDLFVSAKYTFIGRSKPDLITRVKNKISKKHGQPHSQSGDVKQGKASFQWLLSDGIKLTVHRGWPDTTTFVTYSLPEHVSLLEKQQAQSKDKSYKPQSKASDEISEIPEPGLF